jgi:hypothetical protein
MSIQYDPREDYRQKYPEGDELGDVIDCANYNSIDRSQIGKLSKLKQYQFTLYIFFNCSCLTHSFPTNPTNSK